MGDFSSRSRWSVCAGVDCQVPHVGSRTHLWMRVKSKGQAARGHMCQRIQDGINASTVLGIWLTKYWCHPNPLWQNLGVEPHPIFVTSNPPQPSSSRSISPTVRWPKTLQIIPPDPSPPCLDPLRSSNGGSISASPPGSLPPTPATPNGAPGIFGQARDLGDELQKVRGMIQLAASIYHHIPRHRPMGLPYMPISWGDITISWVCPCFLSQSVNSITLFH